LFFLGNWRGNSPYRKILLKTKKFCTKVTRGKKEKEKKKRKQRGRKLMRV